MITNNISAVKFSSQNNNNILASRPITGLKQGRVNFSGKEAAATSLGFKKGIGILFERIRTFLTGKNVHTPEVILVSKYGKSINVHLHD